MIQFCTSERPRTFQLRNTSPSSSYCTLASGGYIIRIRPMAMGMLVVPTENGVLNDCTAPGNRKPSATPSAMARKIHSVR